MVANISDTARANQVRGTAFIYKFESRQNLIKQNSSSNEIQDTYTPSSSKSINDKYYGTYANFIEENQDNSDIMNDLYDKIHVQKLSNPVQAYFDEHNIDVETEYKKYMTKCGVDNDEDLKALSMTPFCKTREELETVTARDLSGPIGLTGGLSIEEAKQLLSSSSVAEFPALFRSGLGENGTALEMKKYFEKKISEDKISGELKSKLTKSSSAITAMIQDGTWGTDPVANIQKYNASLIANYAN